MQDVYTLKELAELTGSRCYGENRKKISGLSGIHSYDTSCLSFIDNPELLAEVPEDVAVVMNEKDFPAGRDGLAVDSFREAMGRLLDIFEPKYKLTPGISPDAVVEEDALVNPTAFIGPNCTVCSGAHIGAGAILLANVYVGPDVKIGDGCVLEPGCVIQRRSELGKRCLIHSCAVIGADGFGIIPGGSQGKNIKIPQIGRVVLGDDVEIGAATCIDRATIAETVIGDGTKMDNQVQIGHNCYLGKNCIVASQSGIAGSTQVGDGVIMGARSGLNGHISVASDTHLAALGIVMKDTKPGQVLSGHPATAHMDNYRFRASLRRVPDLLKRVKKLEKELAELEEAMR